MGYPKGMLLAYVLLEPWYQITVYLYTYMRTHIHIYLHIYIHSDVYMFSKLLTMLIYSCSKTIYSNVYMYMRIHIHIYLHIYIYIHADVYMYSKLLLMLAYSCSRTIYCNISRPGIRVHAKKTEKREKNKWKLLIEN